MRLPVFVADTRELLQELQVDEPEDFCRPCHNSFPQTDVFQVGSTPLRPGSAIFLLSTIATESTVALQEQSRPQIIPRLHRLD